MSPPACATMPRGGSANLLKAPTPPGQGITSAKAKVRDGRQPVDGLTTRTSSSRVVRGTMRDWTSRSLGTRPCLTSCNRCPAADALLRGCFAALRSEPSRRGWCVHRSGCECSVLWGASITVGGAPSQLQNRCKQSQWTHEAWLGRNLGAPSGASKTPGHRRPNRLLRAMPVMWHIDWRRAIGAFILPSHLTSHGRKAGGAMRHHTHAACTQQLLHNCCAAPSAALLSCLPAAHPRLPSPLCQRGLHTRIHKGFQRCLQTNLLGQQQH